MNELGSPAANNAAGRLTRARREQALAQAEHERIGQQVARMRAHRDQSAIDAELRETRRILLRALHRPGNGATAFLDEDFLAVADRPAVTQAIVTAAVTAWAADACDRQLYDRETASLTMAAQRAFSGEFTSFFATLDRTQPSRRPARRAP